MRRTSLDMVTLEWLKVQVSEAISAEVADTIELATWQELVLRHMVVALRAKVLAHQLPPEHITTEDAVKWSVPASPWQHFKSVHAESWWLQWFVARRPVRETEHKVTVTLRVDLRRYHTFPESRVAVGKPELGRPVNVVLFDQELWWRDEVTP